MKLKAVVKYKGALAHYNISSENDSTYQAKLIRYDGKPDQTPPIQITLTRGNGLWEGSSDKQDLLKKIGEMIERRMSDYDHLFSGRNNDTPHRMGKSDQ